MKIKRLSSVLLVTTLGVALHTRAHDPREHLKDAESPNCVAMRDMEHGKMDADDPVMQAMMKQCLDELRHDDEQGDASKEGEPPVAEESGNEHSDHEH